MPVQIPLRNDLARWRRRFELNGTSYELIFRWNGRASAWTLGIRDADGNDLVRGKALRLGSLRLRRHGRASGLPPGDLLLVFNGRPDVLPHTEPSLTSLGVDHQLLYYTSAELTGAGL